MKLAILIPTLTERIQLRYRLVDHLMPQIIKLKADVKLIFNVDEGQKSTGQKSNELIQSALEAGAEYIARFDDDDLPGPTYIQRGIEVVDSGMDCGELWGQIYFNSVPGNPFHHSIDHTEWWQDDKAYYRCPNHLNFVKLELVKDIHYPDITKGEDHSWSKGVLNAGVLKTEYKIPEIIYHYFTEARDHKRETAIMKQIYG